jgi:hypothetical protein
MVKQSVSAKTSVDTLHFRLKHFRSSTIKYVLKLTGYSSLTEYEDLCYNSDNFPHIFTLNTGDINCDYTKVDYTSYRIFHLSIHNLNEQVRKYVLTKLIGMDQVDYELFHHQKNRLYVWIPYKNEESRLTGSVLVNVGVAPGVEQDKKDEIVNIQTFDVKNPSISEELKGWTFKMNHLTKNSYVLTPPKKIIYVKDGKVNWGDFTSGMENIYYTPTSWHIKLDGLQRPIYYNNIVCGWIVSLRYRSQLLDNGAKELK